MHETTLLLNGFGVKSKIAIFKIYEIRAFYEKHTTLKQLQT